MSKVDAALLAIASVRQVARAAAAARPDDLAALAKDVGVLAKLLRNPAENPEEPKFRKVKLSNATVARVLAHTGVRDVIIACGFSEDGTGECLELSDLSEPAVCLLLRAVASVEEVQLMLQELSWVHAARKEVPKLDGQPWNVDTAAREVVQACLGSLHAPWRGTDVTHKIVFVQQLHLIMSTPGMRECRAAVEALKSVAVPALRRVALELIHLGSLDVSALVQANRCLALLWPAGDASTLAGRLEFCSACLEAALPPDDEPMELRLRLTHGNLLGSTIEALGAFSEMGVRCGVLRQELKIEYEGDAGEDAGGLLRQFFDLFSAELTRSPLWIQTAAGGLRPVDESGGSSAEAGASAGGGGVLPASRRRAHMVACGRVCGMALYQELHRRRNSVEAALLGGGAGGQQPTLLGAAFARYFIRVVQHDPPASLDDLRAELRAETTETKPDYRAGEEILSRSVAESGLTGETFVRAAGDVEVPLVEGGGTIALTDANKREWLERLLRSELVDAYAGSASDFRRGLLDVIGMVRSVDADDPERSRWTTPHFFLLSAEELQQQWSGAPVSREFIQELRGIAEVHADVTAQAEWLWQILLALDDDKRAKVFRFVTGSSRRPSSGISDFRIGPKAGGDGAYPFAHACANALDMPSYSSKEVLRERLEAAVEAAHDKFTDL